jgi:hypothetical protein
LLEQIERFSKQIAGLFDLATTSSDLAGLKESASGPERLAQISVHLASRQKTPGGLRRIASGECHRPPGRLRHRTDRGAFPSASQSLDRFGVSLGGIRIASGRVCLSSHRMKQAAATRTFTVPLRGGRCALDRVEGPGQVSALQGVQTLGRVQPTPSMLGHW